MTRLRTAVVTGAGSRRGIGRATAVRLARDGWCVGILDLDGGLAEEAAGGIRTEFGVEARGYEVDVADEAAVDAAIGRVESDLPPVEALANIAGISASQRFPDVTPDIWDRVFRVNVRGTYLVTRRVVPAMLDLGRGRIVNMSSVAGERGGGVFGTTAYSASKAAVLGFTRALARELAGTGVTVNAVAPGFVGTDLYVLTPEREREVLGTIPLARKATPAEVASVFAYLIGDEAAYVTGATYDVNGGLHIH